MALAELRDIAQVRIGYQPRSRIEPDSRGICQLIQIKDLDEQGHLQMNGLYRITPEAPNYSRYEVKRGDVLFLARGSRNVATPIELTLQNTIASGSFFILKLHSPIVLPAYLAWYINSAPAQQYIQNVARRGTHMPVVTKSALEKLEVDMPAIGTQQAIVSLDKLSKWEKSLLQELEYRRSQLIGALSLQAAKRKSQEH